MRVHDIAPIDLVAVNLYPFEATVAKGAPYDECVENIDIGGPALIRAAAKNHDFVVVLTDPDQYADGAGRDRCVRRHIAGCCGGGWPGRLMRGPLPMMRRSPPGSREQHESEFPAAPDDRRQPAADAALWREPASVGRVLRLRRAARGGDRGAGAGQGTILQQPQRYRCRVRVRRRVRGADRSRSSSTPIHAAWPPRHGWPMPGMRRSAAIRCRPTAASSR